jgi:hypothetical protein
LCFRASLSTVSRATEYPKLAVVQIDNAPWSLTEEALLIVNMLASLVSARKLTAYNMQLWHALSLVSRTAAGNDSDREKCIFRSAVVACSHQDDFP